jgi:hypothetical protein
MREEMVRVSFDIPVQEHTLLKMQCVQSRKAMKDFLYDLVIREIKSAEDKELKKRLKKSIQQSKEGKVRSRGSFAEYVENEV